MNAKQVHLRFGLTGIFLALLLAIASCGDGYDYDAPPAHPISYRVYTTTGGDSSFVFGEIGAINQGLLNLLDRIQDGSEVHFAVFKWTIPQIADKLLTQLEAHPTARAYLLLDPHQYELTFPAHKVAMFDRLKQYAASHDQLTIVNERNAHAGRLNLSQPARRRLMHNKFYLFRNLRSTERDDGLYTVAVSTANPTLAEVGESNEMVLIHGDQGLYERYREYWQILAESKEDYVMMSTHTYSNVHDHKAWFLPVATGQDPVLAALDNLDDGQRVTGKPARIRIVMSLWGRCREDLALRLVQLHHRYETDIRIIGREDVDFAPEVVDILKELPPGSVRFMPSRHPKAEYGIHSKLMLIDGPFSLVEDGDPERHYLVFTGSHNWNLESLRHNSENLLRIQSKELFQDLEKHWRELWDKALDSTSIYDSLPRQHGDC